MNPKVDTLLNGAKKWQAEMKKLREIILQCPLEETIKWGQPCYTFNNSNVVLIHGFKEYCAVLFFKGALLNDAEKILIQQSENVQAARQMRFTNLQEIISIEKTLKTYIYEAIEVEKAGLKVELKKHTDLVFPEEFQSKIDQNAILKKAFEALTPGRQRAYNLFFSQPKQAKTRESRIEKSIPKILAGKGLND
ncbi:MAG TPA: DUF1801 domain-containing protein [Pelobium sp.]|nr:DUF1801 domain-containing protein [Pelobium sp.]